MPDPEWLQTLPPDVLSDQGLKDFAARYKSPADLLKSAHEGRATITKLTQQAAEFAAPESPDGYGIDDKLIPNEEARKSLLKIAHETGLPKGKAKAFFEKAMASIGEMAGRTKADMEAAQQKAQAEVTAKVEELNKYVETKFGAKKEEMTGIAQNFWNKAFALAFSDKPDVAKQIYDNLGVANDPVLKALGATLGKAFEEDEFFMTGGTGEAAPEQKIEQLDKKRAEILNSEAYRKAREKGDTSAFDPDLDRLRKERAEIEVEQEKKAASAA